MIKQHSKFILFLLVLILLFTPLFSVEAKYFTGYLDFDFYNLNDLTDSRINTDYSFFLENKTKNNLYYTLKYDSDQSNYDNLTEEHFWLDRSILLKDLSRQNKYLKVKYNNSKLIYGKYKFQVDSPMFADYYNNSHGLKLTYENKKSSANIFTSRSDQVSITDRIINPSYSIIVLNNEKVVPGSETIYVNTLNKDNKVLKTNYLRKKSYYKIDYLKGKVIFDPLIYFLNQPEYNYELIINYKIKEKGLKYRNRGYNLKTKLTRNTGLKLYGVKEQSHKNIKGLILSLNPEESEYYKLEYQKELTKKKKTNISNDDGANYIKNEIKDSWSEKIGIRYFNKINSDNKIQGHSYKSIIRTPAFKEFSEFEHFIKLSNNLNEKINSEIIYRRSDNSLNQNYYQYQTTVSNQINEKLILNTRFKYKNGTSGIAKEKSLDNFFGYKYSEYLDISWGYIHNMPKGLYYGQYEVRYRPKTNSHIILRNKVLNTEYREKLLEYKMANGFKIFRRTQKNLLNSSIVKKSNGLKYKINKGSSISFIDSTYKREVSSKEKIVKYNLALNNNISAGLNQRSYYNILNGVIQKQREGTKISLNIKNNGNTFGGSFDKERNLTDTFKKERLKLSYHKRDISKLYIFTGVEKEIKKDKTKNTSDECSNFRFKLKYRPINNKTNLSYSYLKQKNYTKNATIDNEEDSVNQTLNFSYFFNAKVSLNTSVSKWENSLKINKRINSKVLLLKRLGLSYRFKESWTIKGEYRRLDKNHKKDDSGYLVSVIKNLNKKLSLGVEYNFTDFNNKLSDLSYDNKGLSFNINYKW